ncbi:MAG: ATP-binding protein [Stellaceae bacterium]
MDDVEYSREQIEQQLRETEERFRLAQIASGIGWFEWDLATNQWEWTPPVASFFGFDPAMAASSFSEWERAIFVDDVPKLHAAVEKAAQSGAYYAEFRVRHPDSSVHWIAGKGEARNDNSGRFRWISGVYYEISERKALEARLLALNETLEARVAELREEARTLEVLNRTGAALAAELSLERLVQTVTDAAVELTRAQFGAFFYNVVDKSGEGYKLYALSGAPREAFANFPMPRNTAVFEPTFRGEGPVRSDDILADPRYGQHPLYSGTPPEYLPVRSYLAIPVVSRSGEVLGGLLFGHPEPGVFTQRDEQTMTGIAAQAAIGIDNAQLYEASQRELAARRRAEHELQLINETLEERVAEEIKQRPRIEDALRQAQKMEAVGQLTGGVAHDFNNLLTVVIGNVEAMQRRLPPEHELQRMTAAALRGAFRGAELTQRLLVFARRQPLAPEVASPNKLVSGMSDLLRRTLGESVAVETVLAGGLWNVFADANQLENSLINLAVNARDAMPAGGRLTIETANCYLDDAYCSMHADVRPGQYIGIFVTDTGSGMPEDVVEKAFEPFFTTKGTGQGTGLGLSQVYGFVKQSGGHVKIYSEPGQGTCVKLYLPRHHGAAATLEPISESRPPPRARQGETVLVVEDDADVRAYTVEMVGDLGYEVISAHNGRSALQLLDAHPGLRLLFTDVGLPGGMNGRQLADEAMRRRPDIKVLFTTGYARNAIVHHGRLDPGVAVIFKPFTYSDLAAKIRRAFDN